jgi:predicted nucleic acid-binding protein
VGYWDSSALVKLYVKEPDSAIFEEIVFRAQSNPVTSRVALYEIQTTLTRKEAEGAITSGAAEANFNQLLQDVATGRIRIIEFSAALQERFDVVLKRCWQRSPPMLIRTLDAIHLSSALLAAETELIATDKRLRDAAQFFGLQVSP